MITTTDPETVRQRLFETYLPLRSRSPADAGQPQNIYEDSHRKDGCQFNERLLQAIWNDQRLREPCRTADNRPVTVIAPGTWNLESGPDFRNATVQIGSETRSGDIEIHRTNRDWHAHGHDGDSRYANVILHVVWESVPDENENAENMPPCLELKAHVDRSWQTLTTDIDPAQYPYARQVGPGRCARSWVNYSDDDLRAWFEAAGLARLRDKTRRIHQRIIEGGADQSLYEAVFEALGYKANRKPFRALANDVPLTYLRQLAGAEQRAAALFGCAGFLRDPSCTNLPPEMRDLTARLWDAWWPLGNRPGDYRWVRGGTRPLNSPERRLAAGCELLETWALEPTRQITGIAGRAADGRQLLRDLETACQVNSLWRGFASFQKRLSRPARLLGKARVKDLEVNVFLPFLQARAAQQGDSVLDRKVTEAFLGAPKLQGNRALAEIVHRLLVPPSRARTVIRGACGQQGLLAIYRDFCIALDNDCSNCPLGNPATLANSDDPSKFWTRMS